MTYVFEREQVMCYTDKSYFAMISSRHSRCLQWEAVNVGRAALGDRATKIKACIHVIG